MQGFPRNVMHFEIVRAGWLKRKYRWLIKSADGENVSTSRPFNYWQDCWDAASRVRRLAATAPILNCDGIINGGGLAVE